jgi:hypothetical protein
LSLSRLRRRKKREGGASPGGTLPHHPISLSPQLNYLF